MRQAHKPRDERGRRIERPKQHGEEHARIGGSERSQSSREAPCAGRKDPGAESAHGGGNDDQATDLLILELASNALGKQRVGEDSAGAVAPLEVIQEEDQRRSILQKIAFRRPPCPLKGRAAVLEPQHADPRRRGAANADGSAQGSDQEGSSACLLDEADVNRRSWAPVGAARDRSACRAEEVRFARKEEISEERDRIRDIEAAVRLPVHEG